VTVVLDSWALLRFLEDEGRAAGRVAALLGRERPVVSWVNLGEVYCVLHRRVGEDAAARTVRDLRGVVVAEAPLEGRVLEAARIKATFPLAYADAFAAATALAFGAPLWTGDPELLIPDAPWRWVDLRG
jgi:predicted nucleic acid-binding protein